MYCPINHQLSIFMEVTMRLQRNSDYSNDACHFDKRLRFIRYFYVDTILDIAVIVMYKS